MSDSHIAIYHNKLIRIYNKTDDKKIDLWINITDLKLFTNWEISNGIIMTNNDKLIPIIEKNLSISRISMHFLISIVHGTKLLLIYLIN